VIRELAARRYTAVDTDYDELSELVDVDGTELAGPGSGIEPLLRRCAIYAVDTTEPIADGVDRIRRFIGASSSPTGPAH
jgi:hypothetical protein